MDPSFAELRIASAIRRDPRDTALLMAPSRIKGVCITLSHGLHELRRGANPGPLVSEVSDVWRHRLVPVERGFALMVAARAAEAYHLEGLAMAVLDRSPIPPFDNIWAEAGLWAADASPAERRAYGAALWNHMSDRERAAFRDFIQKVQA